MSAILVPAFAEVLRAGLRFWPKVNKTGPIQPHMDTPCWQWLGAITKSATTPSRDLPYGSFRFNGRTVRAHRFAWLATHGPSELPVIRHDCDNTMCVNPAHLRPGTQSDNISDTVARGRARTCDQRGENNGCAKLSAADVAEAKAACAAGESKASIARRMGVSRSAVSLAVLGKRWRTS